VRAFLAGFVFRGVGVVTWPWSCTVSLFRKKWESAVVQPPRDLAATTGCPTRGPAIFAPRSPDPPSSCS